MHITDAPVLVPLHSDILLTGNDADADTESPDPHSLLPPDHVPPTITHGSSVFVLSDIECIIGRDPSCDVRVAGYRTDISRRHAYIRYDGKQFIIYDKSTHGTFINHNRIYEPYQLRIDDIIGLANSFDMLRFTQPGAMKLHTPTLTERERAVLVLVAAGRLNKEIASELVIAANTVNTHLKSIYEKLGVHNRTEAVHQARRLRLI